MSLAEMTEDVRGILLGMTETTWEKDKADLIRAMLRLRRACEQEKRTRAMHELEVWISVVQICGSPRDVAVAKIPEAVRNLRRMVGE